MFVSSVRRGLGPVSVLVMAIIVSACASTSKQELKPVQSPSDDREYRLLTLDNQMQVLLVSDPDTPKAAAALDINVGSGDNPPGRGGLAHFLEHMLFLGTDKYPDAAEYEEFITEHGGNRNAYTSFENTNYFFDINARYLPEALDRFAQFFIAPKFDAQYVDREKNAVQAEYQMGLKSDSRRGLDVMQEVMNPEHPFSQFAVGSLDSLADRPNDSIRDELLTFYEQHYSANLMRLVVYGEESLDELEAMTVPLFSKVPNNSKQQQEISAPLFSDDSLPLLVELKPQATLRELQVMFPLPDYRKQYSVKPMSYLGNLVGHEGEGSLLSQLKEQGLAESLAAGTGLGWRGGSLFSVSISLTEKGVEQRETVLQLLYAYLDMLNEAGPKEWLYQEQSRLAELSFRFKESGEPMSYVSGLASGMHYYSAQDTLRGPYVMDDYQAQLLSDMVAKMVPSNALIMFSDASAATDTISEHYQVPYSVKTLEDDTVLAMGALHDQANQLFSLPAPNAFIADNVSLVKPAKKYSGNPQLLLDQPQKKIWFAQDAEFELPKGATYINFRSPSVGSSAQQTAAAVLYTAVLKDQLNEYTYPAMLAGLNFSFYKHAQGISLRVSGYDDKQSVLLDELLGVIASPTIDPQRFENIRQDMIRALENAVAKRPASQAMDDLRESLLYGEWGEQPLIDALQGMTPATLAAYAQQFWASASAEALIYGNYEPTAVATLSAELDKVLSGKAQAELPPLQVLKLAASESLLYPVDIEHNDAVLAWYLQGAGTSWDDRAATALTAQIMKSGFFQQLRTEQQLGYIVSAFYWEQLDVPALVMLIQSPVADAADLADAMQAYMEGLLPDISEAQFNRHRTALVDEVLQPDKNLWERAEFYWQSLAKKQFDFDGRQAFADAIGRLTLQDWQQYYRTEFLTQRRSLQVAAPGRDGKLPATQGKQYESAAAIKSSHSSYKVD